MPDEVAQEWVERALSAARAAARVHPPSGQDPGVGEYERRLRGMVAKLGLPTEPYVGLTLPEAKTLAASQSRSLRVVSSFGRRRADFVAHRLRVRLGPDGRVAEARTDGAPWAVSPCEEPVVEPARTVDSRTAEAAAPVLAALHGLGDGTVGVAEAREAVQQARGKGAAVEVERLLERLVVDLQAEPSDVVRSRRAEAWSATFLELRSVVNDA